MGELRGASVTLAEILAYIKQTRQTGRLLIRAGADDDPARLFFEDGRLIDARQGAEAGDDLVYRLLGRRDASYTFDRQSAGSLPTERSISPMQEMLVLAAIGALPAPEPEPEPQPEPAPGAPPPAVAPAAAVAEPAPAAAATPVVAAPQPRRAAHPFRRRNAIPLPPGAPAFADRRLPADFTRLLDLLERDQLSGYVTWFSDGAEGLLVLYYGQVIDAFWAEAQAPATFAEKLAVRRFAAAVDTASARHVEVYRLDPDFVWSYSSLAYGAYRSSDQGMDRVQFAPLIDRLERGGHTGCVKVVANSHAVYVFFCRGRALGEFRALPDALEAASPGAAQALCAQLGSLVDVYTAPTPAALLALNAAAWPARRVLEEICGATRDVLGPKAGQVVNLLSGAGDDPRGIRAAAARAKQATRVFIGPDKHAELSRRIDPLLDHLS
jgi:hypothetical protein